MSFPVITHTSSTAIDATGATGLEINIEIVPLIPSSVLISETYLFIICSVYSFMISSVNILLFVR